MTDGGVAGEHVGKEAHVGGAAGVDVIGQEGEFAVRHGEAELEQAAEIGAVDFVRDQDEEGFFGADELAEFVGERGTSAGLDE